MADLAEQVRRIDEMQNYVPGLVRQARLSGASWESIGKALGVTKQAAQQRYGPDLEDMERAISK